MNHTPKEIGRNPFDEWCWKRGLELKQIADDLALIAEEIRRGDGRQIRAPSYETIRLIRLPFSDGRRRVPGPEVVELIHRYTGGEVPAASFYPDHLRRSPSDANVQVAS